MKKCPGCGMQYQDTENYCMECGEKLIKMQLAEMPPSELMALISHVRDLEGEIIKLKETAIPPAEVVKIASNAAVIKKLREEMEGLRDLASSMSAEDLVSLVTQVGELENAVDDLGEKVDSIRTTEIPEEILDIGKHGKELTRLRNDIQALRATIRKDVANVAVAVLKGVKGEIFQEVQKFKGIISAVEGRTSAEIGGIRKEMDAFMEAQASVLSGTRESGKLKGLFSEFDMLRESSVEVRGQLENLKQDIETLRKMQRRSLQDVDSFLRSQEGSKRGSASVDRSQLDVLREEMETMKRSLEKAELDRVMPDQVVEMRIEEMLSRRMEDIKLEVTRQIVNEIRKTLER